MKNTAYIAPQTKVVKIQGAVVMNAISAPQGTNVTGLGVSNTEYTGESHARSSWDIWGTDEDYED